MHNILNWIALGSIGIWFVGIILVILVTLFVEKGRTFAATFTFIGLIAFLTFAGRIPVLAYITDHPVEIIFYGLGYIAIGFIWGVIRWAFYVSSCNHKFEQQLTLRKADDRYFDAQYIARVSDLNPKVSDHEADLLRWMTYWPFSALWTLVNDPFSKGVKWLFDETQGAFVYISDTLSKSRREKLESLIREQEYAKAEAQNIKNVAPEISAINNLDTLADALNETASATKITLTDEHK